EVIIFSSPMIVAAIEYAARSARVTEEPSGSFTTSLLLNCCATALSVFSISFNRFLVSASSGSVEGSSCCCEVDRRSSCVVCSSSITFTYSVRSATVFVSFAICCTSASCCEIKASKSSVVFCCSSACLILSSAPMSLSLLCVIVEDLLGTFGGELGCQRRGLLPSDLPVVIPAHLVTPAVAVRHRERDPVPGEDMLE